MKIKSIVIVLLAMLLLLSGCGPADNNTPGDPSEPSDPVTPVTPTEPDISNLNTVMYDDENLQVVLVGAIYDEIRSEFNVKLHFEQKKAGSMKLFLNGLNMNGYAVSYPSDSMELFKGSFKEPVEITASFDDIIYVYADAETKQKIGQPGKIETVLNYSVDDLRFISVNISAEAGKNFIEPLKEVTVKQLDSEWYQAFMQMSNPNDCPVLVSMQLNPNLDDYYIQGYGNDYATRGYPWTVELSPHAENVMVTTVEYFCTSLLNPQGKSVSAVKTSGFTGFSLNKLMVSSEDYPWFLDLKDISWEVTKQPAAGKKGNITVQVSWPEEAKELRIQYTVVGYKNGAIDVMWNKYAKVSHDAGKDSFTFSNEDFYKCDSWEMYFYCCESY